MVFEFQHEVRFCYEGLYQTTKLSCLPVLSFQESELCGAIQQLLEGGLQLIAVGKEWQLAEDVKPKPGPTGGHHQPSYIPEVPDCPGTHQ